jgi:hypothetical protein
VFIRAGSKNCSGRATIVPAALSVRDAVNTPKGRVTAFVAGAVDVERVSVLARWARR